MPTIKSSLKLLFIFLASLFLALLLSFYVIFNSSWFWQKISKELFSNLPKEFLVKSIVIEDAHVFPLAVLDFRNVELQIMGKEDAYHIKLAEVVLDFSSILNNQNLKIVCQAKGINVSSKMIMLKNGNLKGDVILNNNKLKLANLTLDIPEVNFSRVVLTSVSSKVIGNDREIILDDFTANLYDGALKSVIKLTYSPSLIYEISGRFNQINLAKLKDVNQEVASKLRGLAEGNIFLQGDTSDLEVMKIYVNIPEQAQIKASLLAPLIAHIPKNSQQRKDLELLMKVDGFVQLDQANLDLESVGKEQIKSKLNLDSDHFDLNVRLSTDINLSGGMLQSLQSLQQILSLTGGGV